MAATVDLMENPESIICFGRQVPVIGVELAGRTAQKVKYLNRTAAVFSREVTAKGFKHSFRLSNEKAAGSEVHPEAPHVVFLFSDESYNEFWEIDLYEIREQNGSGGKSYLYAAALHAEFVGQKKKKRALFLLTGKGAPMHLS